MMTYDLRSSSYPLFLGGSPPSLPQNRPVSASVAAGVALDSTEENLGLEVDPYRPRCCLKIP